MVSHGTGTLSELPTNFVSNLQLSPESTALGIKLELGTRTGSHFLDTAFRLGPRFPGHKRGMLQGVNGTQRNGPKCSLLAYAKASKNLPEQVIGRKPPGDRTECRLSDTQLFGE
jgi:hypothetical protein